MSATLTRPDLCLRVGVVGNRNFDWLDEDSPEEVERFETATISACEEVFSVLDATLEHISNHSKDPARFSDHLARIKIISALAKGGDQLGTLAAMEPANSAERHCQFEFHGLMPFPKADYPGPAQGNENFHERDLARFDDLIGHASSIVRLDGIYEKASREEGDPSESEEIRDAREKKYQAAEAINRPRRYRAYRAQALMLLQHSDVLVAIWDRTAVGKSGGSEETVLEALRVGIPVIHIQPNRDSAQVRFLFRRKDAGRVSFEAPWEGPLSKAVVSLLAFPSEAAGISSSLTPPEESSQASKSKHSGESHVAAEHHSGAAYDPEIAFSEYFHPEVAFATKDRPVTALAWVKFEAFIEEVNAALKELKSGKAIPKRGKFPPGAPTTEKPLIEPYENYRARASELSTRYMGFYRGAYFLSYALAAVAVLFAILGFTAFHYYQSAEVLYKDDPDLYETAKKIAFWCGIFFGGGKLIVLAWILRNQYVAKAEHWQEKAGDYRFLSEMLRPMSYLPPLGMSTPNSRPAAHYADHDPRASWANWLFRAIVRSQEMVLPKESGSMVYTFNATDVTDAKMKVIEHWLPGQINYHRKNYAKHHDLFHLVETINKIALWIVIGAVTAHVGLELVSLWKPSGHGHHGFHPPHFLMVSLLILATFLPACIAISTGLLYQIDARRQSERSQIMASQLESNALKALSLMQDHPNGCNSLHVGGEIRDEIARIMIDEAADWQLLYRMDEVKAG